MFTDVEFGRIQARDLLQHLWTGPISNAPVEIIQVSTQGAFILYDTFALLQILYNKLVIVDAVTVLEVIVECY